MATTVTYKGQTLTTVDNTTKTLETAGTWMEDDLTLTDVSGGGGGATVCKFKYTPASTIQSFSVDIGSFTLESSHMFTAVSSNSGNDPSHATLIRGGYVIMPAAELISQTTASGRVTTRKAGSGSDYWNNKNQTLTQSGTTLTVAGSNNAWFMGGVEYSCSLMNIPQEFIPD